MKVIFDSMITRNDFRKSHISLTCVDYIRNNIDVKQSTNQNVELTLREMILNIPSATNEYGSKFLFQSVDFTADFNKVWWKGSPGEPGAGYILSYFDWDTNYALEVAKGLGVYLGCMFGKTGIYDHFTRAHSKEMDEWEWNDNTQMFSTPETRALAHNVINDPTANIMNNYIATYGENRAGESTNNQEHQLILSSENGELDVQVLSDRNSSNPNDDNANTITQEEISNLSRRAIEIAHHMTEAYETEYEVKETEYEVDKEAEYDKDAEYEVDEEAEHDVDVEEAGSEENNLKQLDEEDQQSTISQLARAQTIEMFKKAEGPDLDSLPFETDGKTKEVNKVGANDEVSVSSSITDLTDNTANNKYHSKATNNEVGESDASAYTIDSIKIEQFDAHITDDMSDEEVEHAVEGVIKKHRVDAQRKANKFLFNRLRKTRENTKQNQSPVKGKQKQQQKQGESKLSSVKHASSLDAGKDK